MELRPELRSPRSVTLVLTLALLGSLLPAVGRSPSADADSFAVPPSDCRIAIDAAALTWMASLTVATTYVRVVGLDEDCGVPGAAIRWLTDVGPGAVNGTLPPGFAILNNGDGTITVSGGARQLGQPGSGTFTLTAEATGLYADTGRDTVTVAWNVYRPPTGATRSIAMVRGLPDRSVPGRLAIGSGSEAPLRWELVERRRLPGSISVAADGSMVGTPGSRDRGKSEFRVRVTDAGGRTGVASVTLRLFARGVEVDADGMATSGSVDPGGRTRVTATVPVRDVSTAAGVGRVTVEGEWRLDGRRVGRAKARTASTGTAALRSPRFAAGADLTGLELCVTRVSGSSALWFPPGTPDCVTFG